MSENLGKDFNFYQRVSVTSGSFPTTDGYNVLIKFRGPRRMMFVCTSGTDIEYSFNGNTVHGRISANQIFNFDVRNEDKIWFKGTGTVDVHAWHIGV
jgi:hypothetical protein